MTHDVLAPCGCPRHREQDALLAVMARTRHADFEHWAARQPAVRFRPLAPDHETALLAREADRCITPMQAAYDPRVRACRNLKCVGLFAHAAH